MKQILAKLIISDMEEKIDEMKAEVARY